tara:strand:- start:43 stop:357 length:315 start_codon:yes stop_codon:yes gene_type:complete
MNPGKLDRKITLQNRTVGSTNAFGEPVVTFPTLSVVYASIDDRGGKEKEEAEKDTAIGKAVFIIRFRTDVSTTTQISYNSEIYDIRAINEHGRKRFLELITEKR